MGLCNSEKILSHPNGCKIQLKIKFGNDIKRFTRLIKSIVLLKTFLDQSRTSRKPRLKMQKLSGRLQESNHTRASSEKRSRHIYFMKDNLLHTISKLLRHVQVHVVTKVLRIFQVAQFTQRKQRSENASSGHLQEVKNNRKSLNFQSQKVVAVAYRRWSFTRGSHYKALTGRF